MSLFRLCLALFLIAFCAPRAWSLAAYQPSEMMVANAQAIALVSVEKIEPTTTKGAFWTYSQKSTATVLKSLKGNLSGAITLYGGENFICASCRFQQGKMLVFLRREGNLWVSNNWQLGAIPVKDGQLEGLNGKKQPLETALSEVAALVKKHAQAPTFEVRSIRTKTEGELLWKVREIKTSRSDFGAPLSIGDFEKWLREREVGSKIRWEGPREDSGDAMPEDYWTSIGRGLSCIDARTTKK